jgi:paraquat-inducible protein B
MKTRTYLIIFGIILVLGVSITLFIHYQNSITFSIIFSNAKGVQKGDGLYLYGIKVGEVKKLYVEENSAVVVVATNRKLKAGIPKDSQFYVIDANQSQKGIEVKMGKEVVMIKQNDYVKANDSEVIEDIAKIIKTIRKLIE